MLSFLIVVMIVRSAARVFFDFDRIEFYDEENNAEKDRYDTIGDNSAGNLLSVSGSSTMIGNAEAFAGEVNDILYVVYTERIRAEINGKNKKLLV